MLALILNLSLHDDHEVLLFLPPFGRTHSIPFTFIS
jgi:hypothetical protein